MPTLIALLRGINVSGQKLIPMERLRKSCEALGMKNVRTYVQSGNVVFQAAGTPATWAVKMSKRIKKDFGYEVPVEIRTSSELGKQLRTNPFLKEKGINQSRLYVTFLSETPSKGALKKLMAIEAGVERIYPHGRELFLHFPNGYGKSKLNNNLIERVLLVTATTRNWNTVNALYKMSRESG